MVCKVCLSASVKNNGCSHCGASFHSPVQLIKESVRNHFINFLLGSFGVIILGAILIGMLSD